MLELNKQKKTTTFEGLGLSEKHQLMNFQEQVAHGCLECYHKLPKSGKATSNEWEIISTFVLELNDEIKVLSLATGSKCVDQSSLSSNGDVINDSHAEILARRVNKK